MIPPPPLDDTGALVFDLPGLHAALVGGVVRACAVCRKGTARHLPLPTGHLLPLCRTSCPPRLLAEWRERVVDGDHAPVATRPTGAYARRARARGQDLAPASPSRSAGSPYFRAGMPADAPWAAVADTSLGRVAVVAAHEGAARRAWSHWRALWSRDLPSGRGEWYSGAVLVDPAGTVVEAWGRLVTPQGPPRWGPLRRLADWSHCVECDAVLWPLRLVDGRGRCRACVEPEEIADPRPWPEEPADPGMGARPPHLGGPKRKTVVKRGGDDHA